MTRAVLLLLLCAFLVSWPGITLGQAREQPETDDVDVPMLERREAAPETFGVLPSWLGISGALRAGAQWIVNPPRAKDDVFGFGALDVIAVARPTRNVTLLLGVGGLTGLGPDQALATLSRVNAESERLEGQEKRAVIREGWLRLQSSDGGVRFNVGKLDPAHYVDRNAFAEDETRAFLNNAFVTNPMLRPPPNGPGVSLRVSEGAWRYAFGVHAPDDFDGDMTGLPYVAGEIGRRNIFALEGHYRWWARVGSDREHRDDVSWGTGISIDQRVGDATGVFLRAGLSRTDGESLTSHAVSLGLQYTPHWLGRDKDVAGIAYGFQREAGAREHVTEGYYNLAVTDWCLVVANVEWIFGRRERSAVVPGIRAVFLF